MKKYIIAGIFVLVVAVPFIAYLIFANRNVIPTAAAPTFVAPTSTPNTIGPTSLPTTTQTKN